MKPYAFSRSKPATKPSFSRKRNGKGEGEAMPNAFGRSLLRSRHSVRERNRHSLRNRRSKQKRKIDRKKRIGSSEAECIQSKKACYKAVIQSEAKVKSRGSSDAECIKLKKVSSEAAIQ